MNKLSSNKNHSSIKSLLILLSLISILLLCLVFLYFSLKNELYDNEVLVSADPVGQSNLVDNDPCNNDDSALCANSVELEHEISENEIKEYSSVSYDIGYKLYTDSACNACHSIDGNELVGPSFKGLYGKENHEMNDGTAVKVDEEYIRDSILYPSKMIVNNYYNIMPSYERHLSEDEISSLILFIKEQK